MTDSAMFSKSIWSWNTSNEEYLWKLVFQGHHSGKRCCGLQEHIKVSLIQDLFLLYDFWIAIRQIIPPKGHRFRLSQAPAPPVSLFIVNSAVYQIVLWNICLSEKQPLSLREFFKLMGSQHNTIWAQMYSEIKFLKGVFLIIRGYW